MKLVHDHDVKCVGGNRVEVDVRKRLDRGKDVPPNFRVLSPDQELSERAIAQDVPKQVLALLQDFLPVSDKEERCIVPLLRGAPVIQSSHNRLSSASCRHDEVGPAIVPFALHRECIKHRSLVLIGADIEHRDVDRFPGALAVDNGSKLLRVIGHKVVVLPVRFERTAKPIQELGGPDLRKANVPLKPLMEG